MKPAYRIPDNDCACVVPGTAPAATRPIGRFTVRSFVTSLTDGQRIRTGAQTVVRGIAFDGGQGIREVGVSVDGGQTWREALLGDDLGRYSFREFTFGFVADMAGPIDVRCAPGARRAKASRPTAVWQPAGYMRNVSSRSKSPRYDARKQLMHPPFVLAAAAAALAVAGCAAARRRPWTCRLTAPAAAEPAARLRQGAGQLRRLPFGRVHAVPAAECRPSLLGGDGQADEGGVQGALDDADIPEIVDYLAATYGNHKP